MTIKTLAERAAEVATKYEKAWGSFNKANIDMLINGHATICVDIEARLSFSSAAPTMAELIADQQARIEELEFTLGLYATGQAVGSPKIGYEKDMPKETFAEFLERQRE